MTFNLPQENHTLRSIKNCCRVQTKASLWCPTIRYAISYVEGCRFIVDVNSRPIRSRPGLRRRVDLYVAQNSAQKNAISGAVGQRPFIRPHILTIRRNWRRWN